MYCATHASTFYTSLRIITLVLVIGPAERVHRIVIALFLASIDLLIRLVLENYSFKQQSETLLLIFF